MAWRSNPVKAPRILAQSAVPTILLPAGVWNNNTGQMAVGTALPYLPIGTVKVYLFASGIAQAGLYDATFTGTAAAPVMQLVGNPATVAGAYAGWTAGAVTLATVIVPGGLIGPNGALRITQLWSANNVSGKTITTRFDGAPLHNIAIGAVSGFGFQRILRNRGVENSQVQMNNSNASDTGGGTPNYLSIDTKTDRAITFSVTPAAATDYTILEGITVEHMPG